MDARDWNASEALYAFLEYVFGQDNPDPVTFEEMVQLMQSFSEKFNLPPTRDGWLKEIEEDRR